MLDPTLLDPTLLNPTLLDPTLLDSTLDPYLLSLHCQTYTAGPTIPDPNFLTPIDLNPVRPNLSWRVLRLVCGGCSSNGGNSWHRWRHPRGRPTPAHQSSEGPGPPSWIQAAILDSGSHLGFRRPSWIQAAILDSGGRHPRGIHVEFFLNSWGLTVCVWIYTHLLFMYRLTLQFI
jgi:hypothetical protein